MSDEDLILNKSPANRPCQESAPAAQDAPVVAAARRAGARIVGKTSLTELCWSGSGVNPWLGTPENPTDPRRVPGGSSSGSAVAIARGEADAALGTDTGGSVRIPAACCGIAGLKTTWGRVPLDGVYPLAPSMDTVGPLGADVAAVELGMRLIDPGFAGASAEVPGRVGRIRPAPDLGVDPATDAAVDAALAGPGGLRRRRVRLPGRQRSRERGHRYRGLPGERLPASAARPAHPRGAAQHDRVGRYHRRCRSRPPSASGRRHATGSPPLWTAIRSWPCRR